MELIECPHCKTRVFSSNNDECPSCRKPLDSPALVVEKGEAPWAAEIAEAPVERVTVGRFVDPIQASFARNYLEAAGIEAFLADAATVTVAWQLSNALGGVKLQVAEPDAPKARSVLREQRDGVGGDQQELVRDAIESKPAPGEGSEELPPEDDGSEDPEPELTGRERAAERAFRAAVFGLLFFPLQFYASFVLLNVLFSSETLAGRARGRAFVAAAINLIYMLILIGFGSAALGI
jgi:Putative prokaryotic signal transducing protein